MLGHSLNHRRKYRLRYLATLASQHFSRSHPAAQGSSVRTVHMVGCVTQSHASTTSKEITKQDKVPVNSARGMLAQTDKPLYIFLAQGGNNRQPH